MNLAWTFGDFVSPKLHRPDLVRYPIIGRWVSSRAAIAIDYTKFFSRSHHAAFSKKTGSTPGCFKNICRFRRSPCRLLRLPKRIGTKVLVAVVGTGSKVILDYVIRRLDALSADLKPVERLNL